MEIKKIVLTGLIGIFFVMGAETEGYSQSAASSDGVIRLRQITIKARVRRPTIQFSPSRIKPVFNLENNSIESMSNQVKERPKSEFYIRKDSELPSGIDGEKIIQRVRN